MGRLLQTVFYLLYHQLAWSYDLVAWAVSAGDWQNWTRATLPVLCGRRILEVGFGPGHLLAAMADAGLAPVGVDLSPQMLRLARRRLGARQVPLVRANGLALPFRNGSFDSVVLTFPAPYVRRAGTELRRVLRPGGRLVIADAARPGPLALGVRLLAWASRQAPTPVLPYEDALRNAGFTVTTRLVQVRKSAVVVAIAAADPANGA